MGNWCFEKRNRISTGNHFEEEDFWGRSSDLQNEPNLQAKLNFQADPTNKSSVLQDGWATFASRLS
jgi:hypothetical protein